MTEDQLRRQLKTLLVVHNIQILISGGHIYANVRRGVFASPVRRAVHAPGKGVESIYDPQELHKGMLDYFVNKMDEQWLQPLIGHINLHYTE